MPIEEYDPTNDPTEAQKAGDARKDYESDPQTEPREAAPPDAVDQDWTQVHPNASREALEKQEEIEKSKISFQPVVPPEVEAQQKADDATA